MTGSPRPRLAVWKFASCDGCQLSLLDCEDELLALAGAVEIANFPEASSAISDGPYDLSLVEGSITTAHDAERIQMVREQSKFLVTIGACATAGGIQALRNFADIDDFISAVYASPQYISTLATSTPISAHVPVDFELHGCPINKAQLVEVISAYLIGRKPAIASHSVCIECKRRGTTCIMVQGTPCLGPVTHAGCGAICPAFGRGCYGCYGPMETPNTARADPRVDAARRHRTRHPPRAQHLQRRGRAVPHREQEAWRPRPSRSTTSPASKARARSISISAMARSPRRNLRIFEPPRFFEAFLRGRGYQEVPDIVARICGICPIAYQMSAVHAIENAFGVKVEGQLRALRRLIYCGEWIESHGAACGDAARAGFPRLSRRHPDGGQSRRRGAQRPRLKKAGNEILRVLGGREIHPVSVRPGGFHRVPTKRGAGAARRAAEAGPRDRRRHGALGGDVPIPRFRAGLRIRRAAPSGRISVQ